MSSAASASAPSVRPVALVIGGGIAGCTAALFLRRAGVEARVFEAYPHVADNVVGGLGLASNGMNVLRSLGLAEKLAARSAPSTAFQFANDSGKILGTAPLNGKQKYGVDGVACTRLALHQVLHAECEAQGIVIQYSKRLTEFDEDDQGTTARFEDGSSAQGAFLVAADGLHSRVRNILFPSVRPEYVGLVGYGGGVPLEDLTEAQRAACPPRGTMRFIFGPLGFFGMSDFGRDEKTGKEIMGWWSNAPDPKHHSKQELAAMTPADIRTTLLGLHNTWASPIPELITRATAADATPVARIVICDVQDLPSWTRGRVVLIGDAAHAMSPSSGQGASQALEDAHQLAVLVKAALQKNQLSTSSDVSALFAELQRLRKPRVDRINHEARRRGDNKKTPMGPWACWFRDRIMQALFWATGGFASKFDWEAGHRVPGWETLEEPQQQPHQQQEQEQQA